MSSAYMNQLKRLMRKMENTGICVVAGRGVLWVTKKDMQLVERS